MEEKSTTMWMTSIFRLTEGDEGVSDCNLYLFFLCALNNYSPFPSLLFIFGYSSLVFDMVGCPENEDLHVFVVANTKLVLHKTSWEMVFILHTWSLLRQA